MKPKVNVLPKIFSIKRYAFDSLIESTMMFSPHESPSWIQVIQGRLIFSSAMTRQNLAGEHSVSAVKIRDIPTTSFIILKPPSLADCAMKIFAQNAFIIKGY